MFHLLLIDDNQDDRMLVIHELRRDFCNFQVEEIKEAAEFNQALTRGNFDLVITDYRLRWTDGITLLHEIKSSYPDCPVIMFTDSGSQEIAVAAMKAGLDDYILKSPKHYARLTVAIRSALKRTHEIAERRRIEQELVQERAKYELENKRLRTILDMLPMGVFIADAKGKVLEINAAVRNIWGENLPLVNQISDYSQYKAWWTTTGKPISPEEWALTRALKQGEVSLGEEIEIETFDGQRKTILNSAVPIRDETGAIINAVAVNVDITERKRTEDLLRHQTEGERLIASLAQRIRQSLNLEEILDTIVAEVRQFLQTDRVLIYRFQPDWNGVIIAESVTNHYSSLLGTVIQDPLAAKTYVPFHQQGHIKVIHDIYTADLDPHHIHLLAQMQVKANLIAPILQGEQLWGLLCAHHCSEPRVWQQLEIDLISSLALQLAIAIQQSELYQQLQYLASSDSLTLLANRRRFDEYFDLAWRQMARERSPLSLVLCDIDFFKAYNDTYGHLAGDKCLQKVASAITQAVKRPADLVARYGGEEFAVLLPNTPVKGALHVAEFIRQRVQQLQLPHAKSLVNDSITLSLGVSSLVPTHDKSPTMLVRIADKALYQAKKKGRNCTVALKSKE